MSDTDLIAQARHIARRALDESDGNVDPARALVESGWRPVRPHQRTGDGHFLDGMTRDKYEAMDHDRLVSEILLRDQQYRTAERDHREHRQHDRNLYATAAKAVAKVVREYRANGKRSVPLDVLTQTLAAPARVLEEVQA